MKFLNERSRQWGLPVLVLSLLLLGAAYLATTNGRTATAGVVQGSVVPAIPRSDTPVVLDGKVLAHARVGDRVFVGGDFQQVMLPDATVITQPYLFAYDIDTGELDPNFRPVLNKLVRALEPTPAGDGLYVGGLFSTWDADFPLRVAKLDAQGNLDTTFAARASARVQSIAAVGDSVYLGGDFFDVSGTPLTGLAKVDSTTGAVDTSLVFNLGPSINGSQLVRRVKAAPDGSALFVLHYGETVNGEIRRAVAKLNLTGPAPTLSGWTVPWLEQTNDSLCWNRLRDMAISPDGAFIVIGGQGADNPPNCDSVLRYSTAGDGVVNFDWSARMYSSVFSLAVSDVAVYVGGHFCAAPKNPIAPGGISSDFTGTANGCDVNDPLASFNPSQRDPDNAVFRKQMAALDPTTGQALEWDPGSNNFLAVFDLTLIDRGLLAGHDRDRFKDIGTGRSGFFDFGIGDDTQPPTINVNDPSPGTIISDPTVLGGLAQDNIAVTEVVIRLKNITTDQWLQTDGSFLPTSADLSVTFVPAGLGEVAWSVPVANLPVGDYEIRGFARDEVGNTSIALASPFTIPGGTVCSVALDADDQPVISWTGFLENGVNDVVIRRDGSFLIDGQPAGAGSYTDTTATPGDHTYLVRWRPNGVRTDVTCTPDPITVPEGGGGVSCNAGLDAASKPVLTWTLVAGVGNYAVREAADGWIATVSNTTTYTVADAAPGDYNYLIRYTQNGTQIEVPCTPTPLTVPGGAGAACTVAVNPAGGVDVNWTAVAGVDTFQVRDAATGWIGTVTDGLSYTDAAPEPGLRTYVLRYREAGTRIDLVCLPDPIDAG